MTIPTSKTSSYKTLEAWRGFASLWVVLLHSLAGIFQHSTPQSATNPLVIFSNYGFLGVQIFFVISGYCITAAAVTNLQRRTGLKEFVRARLRRIFPPYYFATVLAVLLSFASEALVAHGKIPPNYLSRVHFFHHGFAYYFSILTLTQLPLQIQPILVVFWTLCYEVAFYAMMSLFLFAFRNSGNVRYFLNASHIVTIGSLILLVSIPNRVFFPIDLWAQFGLGVLVYDIINQPKYKITRALFVAVSFLVIAFAVSSSSTGNHTLTIATSGQTTHLGDSPIQYITALVFAWMIVLLYPLDRKLADTALVRLLSRIGLFSYSLYLIHIIVVGLVCQIALKVHLDKYGFGWIIALQVLAAISFARLFYQFFERPFIKKSSKSNHTVIEDRVGIIA